MYKTICVAIVLLFMCSYSFSEPVGQIVGDDGTFAKYGVPFGWDRIESSSDLVPTNSEHPKDYYEVSQINDGNEDTAWVEGVKGPSMST